MSVSRVRISPSPPPHSSKLIVFDFDGVIADSETIANQVAAEVLTQRGYSTTLDDAFKHYLGRNLADCKRNFEQLWGVSAPETLWAEIDCAIEQQLIERLRPVPGAPEFVRRRSDRSICIASSSRPEWIARALGLFDLAGAFEGAIFSTAVHVSRGKPHPDIYLHAVQSMGFAPDQTLVIEDSPTGVTAAVAAGATVIGLCAGSHVRDGDAERLAAAGAHHICLTFAEVEELVA